MPITHEWLDNDLVLTTFDTPWTWDEYLSGIDQLLHILDKVDHTIYHLSDYSGTKHLPSGIIARMPRLAQLAEHPNFGGFILFGTSSMMDSMSRIFENVYGNLIRVESKEEALARVDELREQEA